MAVVLLSVAAGSFSVFGLGLLAEAEVGVITQGMLAHPAHPVGSMVS
jgi:hypothetical protein